MSMSLGVRLLSSTPRIRFNFRKCSGATRRSLPLYSDSSLRFLNDTIIQIIYVDGVLSVKYQFTQVRVKTSAASVCAMRAMRVGLSVQTLTSPIYWDRRLVAGCSFLVRVVFPPMNCAPLSRAEGLTYCVPLV